MVKIRAKYLLICLLIILLGTFTYACNSESANPTPLELPTLIPTDTDIPPTPTITQTSVPTITLEPSLTPYVCMTGSQLKQAITRYNTQFIPYFKDCPEWDKCWTNQVTNEFYYALGYDAIESGCIKTIQGVLVINPENKEVKESSNILNLSLVVSQSGDDAPAWLEKMIARCKNGEFSTSFVGENKNLHKFDCLKEGDLVGYSVLINIRN